MGKTYKKKAPAVKKQVTKEELEKLQDLVKKINNGVLQIGNLEMDKQRLAAAVNIVKNDLQVFQNSLQEKYGEVNVNIQTGEIESNLIK
mgnify:FL=1|tara:strand:+ start:164 stop:430 length:267 start_codon:yes stop_codon:yes gene_type:complete